ncbi:hypothetical protein BC830DRAFT_60563 [Chytriomyces sp. MP71]|nr:hypothetical protein BC830DRAFT_60563 [Chytriomyces sp. MP71]
MLLIHVHRLSSLIQFSSNTQATPLTCDPPSCNPPGVFRFLFRTNSSNEMRMTAHIRFQRRMKGNGHPNSILIPAAPSTIKKNIVHSKPKSFVICGDPAGGTKWEEWTHLKRDATREGCGLNQRQSGDSDGRLALTLGLLSANHGPATNPPTKKCLA